MESLSALALAHLVLQLRPMNRALYAAVENQKAAAARLARPEFSSLCISEEHVERKLGVAGRLIADGFGERIVFGTEAGAGDTEFGRMNLALVLAVRSGMQPMAALRSATRIAAEACGVSDETGTLEPGKSADILVVEGDAVTDVGAIGWVLATFRAGVEVGGASRSTVPAADGKSSVAGVA